MTATILKRVVKEAINETLQAHRLELEGKIAKGLEDQALVQAINEGRKSKTVTRAAVKRSLRGRR